MYLFSYFSPVSVTMQSFRVPLHCTAKLNTKCFVAEELFYRTILKSSGTVAKVSSIKLLCPPLNVFISQMSKYYTIIVTIIPHLFTS